MLEWHSAYRTRRLFAILKEMLIAVSGDGPLAQLAEHRTFNPGVVGSIPTRPTKHQVRPDIITRVFNGINTTIKPATANNAEI